MKRIIIILLGLVLLAGAYWMATQQAIDPAQTDAAAEQELTTIASEILAIEAELQSLDQAVSNGTITPEAAAEARTVINARLDAIADASAKTDRLVLSAEQRQAMVTTLETIKTVLIRYQDTLVAVDVAAEQSASAQTRRAFPGSISLAKRFVATVEGYQEQVDDTVQDYEPTDIVLDVETETHLEVIDTAVATSSTDVSNEADIATSSATTTETTSSETESDDNKAASAPY